jgi:two-component system KDP operon response regulator KdpE
MADTEITGGDKAETGKTILIAEDDPFISRMYETKLKASGFQVVIKTNGRDAYAAIKESHPDLLMLDINMPELSGIEVLTSLAGDGYDFASSPAIILTNSSDSASRKQVESLGAEYMVKAEFTPRQVLDKINAKLELKPTS